MKENILLNDHIIYENFLLEFQIKELFDKYQIKTPANRKLIQYPITKDIELKTNNPSILKAQLPINNRLKFGLIKKISFTSNFAEIANEILKNSDNNLNQYYLKWLLMEDIEENLDKEYYICLSIDYNVSKIKIESSYFGGTNVKKNRSFFKIYPEVTNKKILNNQILQLAKYFKLTAQEKIIFKNLINKLLNIFINYDLTMLEINPLAITNEHHFICLDAKATIDHAALFRQKTISEYINANLDLIKDPFYKTALANELNYIPMNGNIACIANGAGLAMFTMDHIKSTGGQIGVFIDIGGGSSEEEISIIFHLLLSNPKINTIVINIFGGILSCEKITSNLIKVLNNHNNQKNIFVRLCGRDNKQAKKILTSSVDNIFVENNINKLINLAISKGNNGGNIN